MRASWQKVLWVLVFGVLLALTEYSLSAQSARRLGASDSTDSGISAYDAR
jgi:hypothetical protein